MHASHVVTIGGVFAGAAIQLTHTYRFVAVDPRVEELDLSEWPSLHDVERVVRHLFLNGRLPPRPAPLSQDHAPCA